jgi:hypothetical protein
MSILGAIVAAGFAGSVAANELIVTSEKSGSARVAGLDVHSSGNASALQARFNVGPNAKVNLASCAKNLPKTHAGTCGYANGVVTVLVWSDTNALLPAGLVSLGTIGVSMGKGGVKALELSELLAFDAAARPVDIKSDVSGQN